jgi:hypothetical protein
MTATTQINQWLNEMQDGMIASLKTYMYEALVTYVQKVDISQEMTRDEWIKMFNSQCIVTITQLLWTKECETRIVDKKPYAALDE